MAARQRFLATIALLMGVLLGACSHEPNQNAVQTFFAFPDTASPFEPGWQYRAMVTLSSSQPGSLFRSSAKAVSVRVEDAQGMVVGTAEHHFDHAAFVEPRVLWQTPDRLLIQLVERGRHYDDDPHASALAERGEQLLTELQIHISIEPSSEVSS